MARLHEFQGKALLAAAGIAIPNGGPARSAEEARQRAEEIGRAVAVKGQAWVTGRASMGAIRFAENPEEAARLAGEILGMRVKGFTIDTVLVEERLSIEREFYTGILIDDRAQAPAIFFSLQGGSGIEDTARQSPETVVHEVIDIHQGLPDYRARDLVRAAGIHGKLQLQLGSLLSRLYAVACGVDARTAEINPIALTPEGRLYAADCRVTVDDYAVFRQKALGIEVAREYDRPPTALEKIAWRVEENDYRGTFYFIQLEQDFKAGEGVIGFHGAGGGGSMMSMDAVLNLGYRLANFVDTSGNPPASKVYRAARIILSQPGLDGYFASGSGVASQEQFHSARGFVKAFLEAPLTIPAVIRLGGNAEEQAIAILEAARNSLPAPLEGYGKDASPEDCAARLDELIRTYTPPARRPPPPRPPLLQDPYEFLTVTGGRVTFDHAACRECESKACIETCVPGILQLEGDVPVLNIPPERAAQGGCTECLACEVECRFHGEHGGHITLPIHGLEEWITALDPAVRGPGPPAG